MPGLPGGAGDRQPSGSAANVVKQKNSARSKQSKQNQQNQQQYQQEYNGNVHGDDDDDNNEGFENLGGYRRPEENIEFNTPFLDNDGPQFNNSYDYDGKDDYDNN